jgi:hypothetical protein
MEAREFNRVAGEALPIVLGPGRFTRIGALLPADLAEAEWRGMWPKLRAVHSGYKFILGDWLNFGAARYGPALANARDLPAADRRTGKYARALAAGEEEYQTLANCAWVCRRVPFSRRRETLTFTHHAEVAALEAREQARILDRAEAEGWSAGQLRRELRARAGTFDEPLVSGSGLTMRGWLDEGMRRWQAETVKGWARERKEALRGELGRLRSWAGELERATDAFAASV